MTSTTPNFVAVWDRIGALAGQAFSLKRGAPFTYAVEHGCVLPSRTRQQIPKSQFKKALARVPLADTRVVKDLRGPSFIYAILMDDRIRAGEWGTSQAPVPRKGPVLEPSSPPRQPQQPTPSKLLSVDDLADLRRRLTALLDSFDKRRPGEPIGTRISRLSHGGPIPRYIAPLMKTITERRNSMEYESKVLSASECAVVRHAWQAIQEWSQSRRA